MNEGQRPRRRRRWRLPKVAQRGSAPACFHDPGTPAVAYFGL